MERASLLDPPPFILILLGFSEAEERELAETVGQQSPLLRAGDSSHFEELLRQHPFSVGLVQLRAGGRQVWESLRPLFHPDRHRANAIAFITEPLRPRIVEMMEAGVDVIAEPGREIALLVYDLKRAVAARWLKQMHRKLLAAIDAAPCGITIADATQAEMPLTFVNSAFEKVTGFSADEALGKNCRFLQSEDTDPADVAYLRAGIEKRRTVRVTLTNRKKDGTNFINELHLAPLADEHGQVSDYIGIQLDVTAREKALQKLMESEARLRALVGSPKDH